MKYKPYFLVQRRGNFNLKYFNGRFMFAMNCEVLQALLSENITLGEKFNCVISAALSAEMCKQLNDMFADYPDNTLQMMASQLSVVPWATLQMNPQMAHTLIAAIRYVEGLKKTKKADSLLPQFLFEFEANWKGIEVMQDVFGRSSDPHVSHIACSLNILVEDLRDRQEQFEEKENTPKGYLQ